MTGLSREELKTVLGEIFEERSRIESEKHCEHHEWIQLQIEKERARIKRMEEWTGTIRTVRKRILEWSLYALFFAIATKIVTGHWPDWPNDLPGG